MRWLAALLDFLTRPDTAFVQVILNKLYKQHGYSKSRGNDVNAEKEIVNLWLQKQGFFTVIDTNARSRVIDIIASKGGDIWHVEVYCSVTAGSVGTKLMLELQRKFNDTDVMREIKKRLMPDQTYERVLVTSVKISLSDIKVMPFAQVLYEVVNDLDTQNYGTAVVRSLQIFKYILLADPSRLSALLTSEGDFKSLTSVSRADLAKDLLEKDVIRRIFRKKDSERILIDLLRESSLRNPDRLASAIDKVMNPRTASRFLNVLLAQKKMEQVVSHEFSQDQKLQKFIANT